MTANFAVNKFETKHPLLKKGIYVHSLDWTTGLMYLWLLHTIFEQLRAFREFVAHSYVKPAFKYCTAALLNSNAAGKITELINGQLTINRIQASKTYRRIVRRSYGIKVSFTISLENGKLWLLLIIYFIIIKVLTRRLTLKGESA